MSVRASTLFYLFLVALGVFYIAMIRSEIIVHHTIRTSPVMVLEPHRYNYYPFGDPAGRYVPQDVI